MGIIMIVWEKWWNSKTFIEGDFSPTCDNWATFRGHLSYKTYAQFYIDTG